MTCTFDGPAWPFGEEWPAGVLPKPCFTLEVAVLELEVLIRSHDKAAIMAERDRELDAEPFHKVRARAPSSWLLGVLRDVVDAGRRAGTVNLLD